MIPLSAQRTTRIPGDPAIADPLVAEWLGHYEAGRLGPRQPMPPELLAVLEHNDAVFRGRAARHAAALRAIWPGSRRMNMLATIDAEIDVTTPEGRAAVRQRHDGWLPDKQRHFLEAYRPRLHRRTGVPLRRHVARLRLRLSQSRRRRRLCGLAGTPPICARAITSRRAARPRH